MAKQIMRRQASDNKYLHKDFHAALNCGIIYLHQHFGEEAVRKYLRDFTLSFYAPLRADLKKRGLVALKEHFEKIYRIENGDVDFKMSENELTIIVKACPAVMHIRKLGKQVSPLFYETTKTVNETLCEGTPFTFELNEYEPETGRSVQRFYRRAP